MADVYSRAVIDATLDLVRPLLDPYCEVLTPAGSYRRGRPFSHDLDLVAVPSQLQQQGDMFGGGDPASRSPLTDRLVELRNSGRITFLAPPGHQQDGKHGDRMARFWLTWTYATEAFSGDILQLDTHTPPMLSHIPIDLYTVLPPATYAVILAIRTGSVAWNAAMMAWLKSDANPHRWRIKGGALQHRGRRLNAQPRDEGELYECLGLAYATPPQRESMQDFQKVTP